MSDVQTDLNAAIAAAVNAKVEAALLTAFTNDAVLGAYITQALQQQVEVPSGRGYGKDRVTFVHHLLSTAIRQATTNAVKRIIDEQAPQLEEAIAKALRAEHKTIAHQIVGRMTEYAGNTYGVKVEGLQIGLVLPTRD